MKGLLARIPRRRPPADAVRPDGRAATGAAREGTDTTVPEAQDAAGVPLDQAAALRPSFRDRGRLRRRLRYLRRVRELGFRDLGGLLFDQHRFNRPGEELVRGKLGALGAVDRELRALETLLDDRRPIHELREAGVAACVRCGALHGSDARFCPSCGVSVSGPRAVHEIVAAAPAAALGAQEPPASPPAQETPVLATQPSIAVQPPANATPVPAPSLEPQAEPPTEIRPSDAAPRAARERPRSLRGLLARRHPAREEP